MKRPTGLIVAVIVLAILCLPAIYFLSIAPARKLVADGSLPQDTYSAIYWPLLSAPIVGDWARDYARWWVRSHHAAEQDATIIGLPAPMAPDPSPL
jgi:hypothetical protein